MNVAEYLVAVQGVRQQITEVFRSCATNPAYDLDDVAGAIGAITLPLAPATNNEVCQKRIDEVAGWLQLLGNLSYNGCVTDEWTRAGASLFYAIERLRPYSVAALSRPRRKSEFCRILDISLDTLNRRIEDGTYSVEVISSKTIRMPLDKLPEDYDDTRKRY